MGRVEGRGIPVEGMGLEKEREYLETVLRLRCISNTCDRKEGKMWDSVRGASACGKL